MSPDLALQFKIGDLSSLNNFQGGEGERPQCSLYFTIDGCGESPFLMGMSRSKDLTMVLMVASNNDARIWLTPSIGQVSNAFDVTRRTFSPVKGVVITIAAQAILENVEMILCPTCSLQVTEVQDVKGPSKIRRVHEIELLQRLRTRCRALCHLLYATASSPSTISIKDRFNSRIRDFGGIVTNGTLQQVRSLVFLRSTSHEPK